MLGKILNFGSLNIDRVYRVEHFVRPGETISSRGYQCFPGGKGLNQSIAAARAGAPVFHAGTVGTDGDFLAELLRESRADIRYVRKTDGMTGHALIQVNDEGENCIILYQGTNFDNDTAYMEQVLSDFGTGDILLLQNEISNLSYLLKRGKEKGMRIMLNPSPMDAGLAGEDLSGVSWLMLNETEGCALTGEQEPERIMRALLSRYPEMQVVLTLGGEGAMMGGGEQLLHQPCFRVKTVDTTAAGDLYGLFCGGCSGREKCAGCAPAGGGSRSAGCFRGRSCGFHSGKTAGGGSSEKVRVLTAPNFLL